MRGSTWTENEIAYLEDKWGTISISSIAKNLGRTESSILNKAQRLGLGRFLESGDYITFFQLLGALGYDKSGYDYKLISWVENRGFPLKTKIVRNCKFKVVNINDFWKWAEKNKDFLDFSRFEENVLGEEPQWVKTKRRYDIDKNRKYIKTPWTKQEDDKLRKLLKDYKYSYDDLSKIMRRTCGAIQRRVCDLNIKERPIKAYNHNKYTMEEMRSINEWVLKGFGYELMSEKIGRSTKALRGFIYRIYGTESLDKARMVGKESIS